MAIKTDYRLLGQDEPLRDGDEWETAGFDDWEPVPLRHFGLGWGQVARHAEFRWRRPVGETVTFTYGRRYPLAARPGVTPDEDHDADSKLRADNARHAGELGVARRNLQAVTIERDAARKSAATVSDDVRALHAANAGLRAEAERLRNHLAALVAEGAANDADRDHPRDRRALEVIYSTALAALGDSTHEQGE